MRKKFLLVFFISIFIFLYFIFFYYAIIVPNRYIIHIVLLMGFAIVISGAFFFTDLNQNEDLSLRISFRVLSENSIKIILIIFMCLSFFIHPISSPRTIILWEKVELLNYIRAITFILGCAFLPGASIFNIFLYNTKLDEKFKVEPLLIKITLYPILSFSFLGFSVFILDQIGLNNTNLFVIILFTLILGLYISELVIQRIRKEKVYIFIKKINISKYTMIILIISLGVSFIAIGIHIGMNYLIPGDSWAGLAPTNYIGKSNLSPIEWGESHLYYPIFWAYVIFGFSVLGGLPFININALLAPFCYLYVTSVYLLMKSILLDFEEKYAVLSTILVSISSGLFYFISGSPTMNLPAITFSCEFYFIYKSFSYLVFILGLSIFIIISKTVSVYENKPNISKFGIREYKLQLLAAFFLILSFMLYAIPFLIGLVFIYLYCLFTENKKKNFQILSQFIIIIALIFMTIDLLMEFYLSSSVFNLFQFFFQLPFLIQIFGIVPIFVFIYLIFLSLLCFNFLMLIFTKYINDKNTYFSKFKPNYKDIFKYFLVFFTILLIIEISSIIIEELYLGYDLDDKILFFYYLDIIYLNIGFIGILGVYFSYFCFKKRKNMFLILTSWIIASFLIGSFFIIIFSIENFSFFYNKNKTLMMGYWFGRIWFYSIFPLCIFASLGMKKLEEKLQSFSKLNYFFSNNNKKKLLKFSSLSLLIFLSYSSLISSGLYFGNSNYKPKKEEIEVIEWMSEELPQDSKILIEYNYYIRLGIFTMTYATEYYINKIFKSDFTQAEFNEEINYLKDEKIQYLLISEEFLEDNSNRTIFFKFNLIPNFYNESLYESDDFRIYYAPFFD